MRRKTCSSRARLLDVGAKRRVDAQDIEEELGEDPPDLGVVRETKHVVQQWSHGTLNHMSPGLSAERVAL